MRSQISITNRIERGYNEYRNACRELRRERQMLLNAQRRAKATLKAMAIVDVLARRVQQTAHERIAEIVSRSLEAVFDEPYIFKIEFARRGSRTEVQLLLERDGMTVDAMSAAGGGVVDVAAFALRLACLLLARPPRRRLLVLDEPFRFVSVDYRERIRDLLMTLAEELKCQFLIVTHQRELECGKVIRI